MTVYVDLNKTANANNMAIATLVSDNASMNELKIKVLKCEERTDPECKLQGREGYSYTVELTDKQGKNTLREVYMFCSEGSKKDYDMVAFVKIGAEGENFYKLRSTERWANDEVTPEIKEALRISAKLTPQEKQERDLGPEARARIAARAIMVSDQTPMTEQTIKVLKCEDRKDPYGSRIRNRMEGMSYTVEISDAEGEKTVREIFLHWEGRGSLNYDWLKYVDPRAAGDNFYDPMSPPRFTDEKVGEEIKEALKIWDGSTAEDKMDRDLGVEARSRLTARAGAKTQLTAKPN